MAEDEGVPIAEVWRRVAGQDRLVEVAEEAAAKRPTSAGAYIDQGRGGRLVVLDTDPDGARAALPSDVQAEVIVEDATWSTRDLMAAARRLQRGSGKGPREIPVTTDVRTNQLEIGAAGADAERVRSAVATENRGKAKPIARVVNANRKLAETAGCQYYHQLCDAPLRGGIGISRNTGQSLCTAGFNVESIFDQKKYVLTAGHCTADAGTWRTEFVDESVHVIGDSWSSYWNDGTATDAGLVKINNPAVTGWHPQWWVLVRASYGTVPTNQDTEYDITGTASSVPGSYICKTGLTTASRCGAIWAVGQAHPQLPVWQMGVAAMMNCQGDSGGPLYKGGKAYGITSAGDNNSYTGTLTFDTGIGERTVHCYSATWYIGASVALSFTNTKLIGT